VSPVWLFKTRICPLADCKVSSSYMSPDLGLLWNVIASWCQQGTHSTCPVKMATYFSKWRIIRLNMIFVNRLALNMCEILLIFDYVQDEELNPSLCSIPKPSALSSINFCHIFFLICKKWEYSDGVWGSGNTLKHCRLVLVEIWCYLVWGCWITSYLGGKLF
jgi:hypothetical protein